MKKLFTLIFILIAGLISTTFGQDEIVLTFTAQNNGKHVPLDSIRITNLTQRGDTILYAPDTTLSIIIVGMDEHYLKGANSFALSSNYPNPFTAHTSIDLSIAEKGNIKICILDLLGRVLASYDGNLDVGKHTFTFYPGNESFYIFSASYCGLTRSIKIANPISLKQDCKLKYEGIKQLPISLKTLQEDIFPFDFGDNLRYIGYSITTSGIRGSNVIEDKPEIDSIYTFEITEGIPCVDVPIVYINFLPFYTIQIGTQCWLKKNLDRGTMILGIQEQSDNGIIEKYCFDDDPANCDIYGGLYQGKEAMKYNTMGDIQGICPNGWHIPTDEEWKQLEGEVDSQYDYPDSEWNRLDYRGYDVGRRLKTQAGWSINNGMNYVGFSYLPSGTRRFDGVFMNMGSYSGIWSSSAGSSQGNWYRFTESYSSQVSRTHNTNAMGRPVRCIKD